MNMNMRSVGFVFLLGMGMLSCGGGKPKVEQHAEDAKITLFDANPKEINAGEGVELTAVYSQGTGVIDPGSHNIGNNGKVVLKPMDTTTYVLTVTNPAGKTVSKSVTVKVVPLPLAPQIEVSEPVFFGHPGQKASLKAPQADCTFEWTGSKDLELGQKTGAEITFKALTLGEHTLSCTATNALGKKSAVTVIDFQAVEQKILMGELSPQKQIFTVGSEIPFRVDVTGGLTNKVDWRVEYVGPIDSKDTDSKDTDPGTIDEKGLWKGPKLPKIVKIIATSQEDPRVFKATNVAVYHAPFAQLILATDPVPYGASAQLIPIVHGGIATLTGFDRVDNRKPLTLSASGLERYTLKVTNPAEDYALSEVQYAPQARPMLTYLAKDFSHKTGQDADDGYGAQFGKHEAGWLCHGTPKDEKDLAPGHHVARTWLKISNIQDPNGKVATLSVLKSGIILAEKVILASDFLHLDHYTAFDLSFVNAEPKGLEFRTQWEHNSDIVQSRVEVLVDQKWGSRDVCRRYWAKDLPNNPTDCGKNEGLCRVADPEDVSCNKPGYLCYGPYTTEVPPGKHVVSFNLTSRKEGAPVSPIPDNPVVAKIDVNACYYNNEGEAPVEGRVLSEKDVTLNEIRDGFKLIELPFDVIADPRIQKLEFRVSWTGAAYLKVERIEVDGEPEIDWGLHNLVKNPSMDKDENGWAQYTRRVGVGFLDAALADKGAVRFSDRDGYCGLPFPIQEGDAFRFEAEAWPATEIWPEIENDWKPFDMEAFKAAQGAFGIGIYYGSHSNSYENPVRCNHQLFPKDGPGNLKGTHVAPQQPTRPWGRIWLQIDAGWRKTGIRHLRNVRVARTRVMPQIKP